MVRKAYISHIAESDPLKSAECFVLVALHPVDALSAKWGIIELLLSTKISVASESKYLNPTSLRIMDGTNSCK